VKHNHSIQENSSARNFRSFWRKDLWLRELRLFGKKSYKKIW